MASLNLPRLTSPRFFAVHPLTGRPIAFGRITFYAAGTTTLRTVYSDRAGNTQAPNPVPLDAAGSCEVFLSGPYRIVVADADGAVVYEADRVNSIPVETADVASGGLLAVNNLSDLIDPAAAREALELAKQADPADVTSGRLLAVGAFGLGASAPEITVSANAIDDPDRVMGWVAVSAANAGTVGAPAGASRGILHTVRSSSYVNQVYYPLTGGKPWSWRRIYADGAWTPWIREVEDGGNSTGVNTWVRQAGGLQHCFHAAATFTYVSNTSLGFTWIFPVGFSTKPVITASLDSEGADNLIGGVGLTWFGPIRVKQNSPTSCDVFITRDYSAPGFVAAHELHNVSLHAVGRWAP